MKNERLTEGIVRSFFASLGFSQGNGILVEEQKSANPHIEKLLKSASKSGNGVGKPEFIVTKNGDNDLVIVVECKVDTKYHISPDLDQYRDYAVDGALLYASHLARDYDVIAIGVSGQSENNLHVSTYLHPKGAASATPLMDENGVSITHILPWKRYVACASHDPARSQARHADLMRFSHELHNYMRDYAKITEAQKPLLVSGILLALMDKGFERAYGAWEGEDLAQKTFQSIKDGINRAQLGDTQEAKKRAVINAFSFIEHHPELHKFDTKKNESPLAHIIRDLHVHVQPFIKDHFDFDIIGSFYGEFIRYTGGDGKGLGIVLTPKHVTDLFADLAKLNKNSVVLDICCGTGGFLISAMKKMIDGVETDDRTRILSHSLIGIEQEPQMFALAVSNMILRGDGKTNLYQGSCFDETMFDKIRDKASVGFINPPYSQKGESLHEWDFVARMLDGLQRNATGIAIVPMSLAIAPHSMRERILREHRLEAVMSMPDDLFYPVGVVTCIMVFTAHVPHESDNHHESWFGYWKDDGFRKDKVKGRIPTDRWPAIKEEWLDMFRRKETPGKSVWKKVGVGDEWCAEAYLETDYSNISEEEFEIEMQKYWMFKTLNEK
ncbi:MAG: N-6 DNA methylase [Candidatus Moraniibacteriota bacterium]